MLNAIAQVLLCGAFALVFRWLMHRQDAIGRPVRFPAFALAALLIPAVVVAIPGLQRLTEERRLAAAASEVAGVKVHVHCQTVGEAFVDAGNELGYVKWGPGGIPERKTLLKYDACHWLRAYIGSSKSRPTLNQIIAVHVVTHEAMHMKGITNEAKAECAAVQRDVVMAQILGASVDEARALLHRYWREVYPNLSADYITGACAPGGALDEHLPNPPWT